MAHVVVTAAAWPAVARADAAAQTDPKVEIAAGDAAARTKDWGAALTHYRAADKQLRSQHSSMGVADALYLLGRLSEAYEAYADVQATYGARLSGADKATVVSRIAEIAPKTGWLSIRVRQPGADVVVDGKPFGTSPVPALVRVPVGPHVIAATKPGFQLFGGRTEVPPDGKSVVEVDLASAPSQAHLLVRATGESGLRVLIDGVDVGAAPWEGDVAPGAHEVAGRSSSAGAPAQAVTVAAGERITLDLAASSTAAHLQVRTSDGKGVLSLDGTPRGQGALSLDVAPGEHRLLVTRDGYKPALRTWTLAPNEARSETVTLEAIAATSAGQAAVPERPFEGVYGGFALAAVAAIGGEGTELETNCNTLGAASCDTPSPFGGAVFGYVGYSWNPVGFEMALAASFDESSQTAHFDGNNQASGTLPFASPARTEKFNFYRVGGVGALRVRASFQAARVRGTVAAGVGISYKEMFMTRHATALDGSGRADAYVPDSQGVLSPAISAEAAVQWRLSPTFALSVGLDVWADNAGSGVASPPSSGHALGATGSTPLAIPTPQYHYASGPQAFLVPFFGMQFGP